MASHKIYTRNCGKCDREFQTDQGNRRNCFICAPARIVSDTKGRVTSIRPPEYVNQQPAHSVYEFPPQNRPVDPPPMPHEPRPAGAIEKAITSELEVLEWLESVEGQLAVALARELDGVEITGASRTSMTKQLTSMIVAIRESAPSEPDEIDEAQTRVRLLRSAE